MNTDSCAHMRAANPAGRRSRRSGYQKPTLRAYLRQVPARHRAGKPVNRFSLVRRGLAAAAVAAGAGLLAAQPAIAQPSPPAASATLGPVTGGVLRPVISRTPRPVSSALRLAAGVAGGQGPASLLL